MQRLPNTQIEIDFQSRLLIMQLMRQADAEQVGSDFLDAALALFEERPQGASLFSVTQSEHDVHLRFSREPLT